MRCLAGQHAEIGGPGGATGAARNFATAAVCDSDRFSRSASGQSRQRSSMQSLPPPPLREPHQCSPHPANARHGIDPTAAKSSDQRVARFCRRVSAAIALRGCGLSSSQRKSAIGRPQPWHQIASWASRCSVVAQPPSTCSRLRIRQANGRTCEFDRSVCCLSRRREAWLRCRGSGRSPGDE